MNLPRIFGDNAEFIEPQDLTGLDAATLERLDGVRVASRNLKAAEEIEAAKLANVSVCMEAINAAEKYRNENYPPDTFLDNWMASFGNEQQRREYAARKHRT